MRKRIISLLLSLIMIISMMPMFTTTASAATTHNPYHKDENLCYMLPYAHNAMLWSSPEYYITHYNIKHVYNYANLKKSFDRGIPQTLANALDNTPNSIITVANELFNFDGEFTEQDFYDYLLTSMLIGNAVSEAQSVDDANTIKEILNMSVDGIEVSNGVVFSGKLIDLLKKVDFSNAATATNTLKSINEKSANVYSKLTAKLPNGSFESFFRVLSCVLQTIEELDEAYQLCAAYEIIYENLGDDAGLVLQYMELSTSDPLLKASISKYERIVNSDDYWTTVVATGLIEGLNVAEEITMNILTTVGRSLITAQLVEASSVWGAFFIGYTFADLLLGISDYVEYINEITRYSIIDNTLLITIASLENICTNNENTKASVEYCDAYIFAMKMAWRLQTEELEKCKEFFEKGQKKGWFGDYFKDEENLEQWNNSINYCINAVANVKPTAFVNNALDQYSRDLDLIIAGYKITYDSNGGTEIPSGTKKYNEPYSLTNTIPTKDGYTFAVWQLGDNTYYSPGYELEASLNPCWCSRELVFTAQWAKKQDTITYNANGGTGAPAPHENTEGPTAISATVPTRTGFTFLGWSESATATTATYQSGDTLTKEGSVTLYAVWQAGTFDIVFHANNGTFADGSDSKTMQKTYLQNFNINPEIPTRDGYIFSGYWTLNADGSGTQYEQGKTFSDIGGAGLSAKHLYAHWTKVKTEATFRYDYTNCTYTDIIIPLTNGSASITLIDPPAEKIAEIGKEFVQWKYYYPDGSGYKYYKTGDTVTITNDFTVYAEWADPADDTILSVLTDKTTYLPGDTVKISITADNSGYFTVDASDNAGFTVKNAEGNKTTSGVFVENSSESTSTNLKCYNNGSAYTVMLYIPNNCSDGTYTVDIAASNGTYGVSGTETSTASETITITVDTSEEEVASYILSYNLNGGYGTIPDSEYFEEGDHVELADDGSFQRDGYEFGGWSKNSDGSGKTYKAGRDYQFTESTLLYAIWEPVAADTGELSLVLGVERYSKVYKPGETAHIIVSPDNSDHFFIDVSDCAGFTVLSALGTKLTEATYIEYSSPAFISGRDGYTDGSNKYIPVYIPSNCKDGQYTFFVTATDGILDQTTGEKIKCSVTIYVRESDIPDSIQLSKSEITLHVGDKKRLDATVEPQHIFNHYNQKEVTWKTSNKNVASIDDKGNSVDISGIKSGTAIITATVDGVSASCTVTVVSCDYSLKIVDPEYLASAATCEKQAEYYYVCSCGDVGSATYKVGELADHNYSAWTVIQQATETTAGVEQRVCSACGATEERSIPATGAHTTHTPGTAWYSDSEKHWHVCSVDGCTVKLNEDTHDFGELSVETPATETNTGIGYRTCGSCGYTQSVVIPVLSSTLYAVLITDGTGGGLYTPGTQVTISAGAADTDKQFKSWIGLDEVIIVSGSVTSTTVTFVMPAKAVNVCATYEDSSDVPQTNSVLVFYGSGDGSYEVGETVTIKADKYSGTFQYWEVLAGDVSLKNANANTTTFTMPANDVELRAVCTYDGTDEVGASAPYYVFGKIESFTSGGYYKVTFLNEQGKEHTYSYGKRADFEICGVAPGTYTLRVSKSKHITQEYTIVVEGDVVYNVALPLEPTVTANVSSISQKGTTIQINATSAEVVGGNIVVATYDGYNKMMDVQLFDAAETIEALIPMNGVAVKIMWIASLKSCIPVCGATSVELLESRMMGTEHIITDGTSQIVK